MEVLQSPKPLHGTLEPVVGAVGRVKARDDGEKISVFGFEIGRQCCGFSVAHTRDDLPEESPSIFTTEVHPKGYLLQPGDIAVGMDGEFRAYLWAGVESWLNQRVCVFAPKPSYSAAFVRNSIVAPLAHVEATETATTVIHIGKNDIDRFTVIIPDAPVTEAFKRQCQPWYDRIVINKQQSRTLATLRDTLLPELLSGKVSVHEVILSHPF